MSEYRIEEDVLGKVKVPADKYWKSQTQRSLENFPIGKETMPKSLLYAFSLLKEACARDHPGTMRRHLPHMPTDSGRPIFGSVSTTYLADRQRYPDQHEF